MVRCCARASSRAREAAYVADVTDVDALTGARLSEGASGAFLLHSKCGRYVVKTLTAREQRALHSQVGGSNDVSHKDLVS